MVLREMVIYFQIIGYRCVLTNLVILLWFVQDADGGSYELITFNADTSAPADASGAHRGPGLAAVFVARNRFAVLDKNRQVLLRKSFYPNFICLNKMKVVKVTPSFCDGSPRF